MILPATASTTKGVVGHNSRARVQTLNPFRNEIENKSLAKSILVLIVVTFVL